MFKRAAVQHVYLLHEVPHQEFRGAHGVYRLRHATHEFHVRTHEGRPIFSDLVKVGETLNFGNRLRQYKNASTEYAALNQFLEDHQYRIEVEFLLTDSPKDRLKHEAALMLAHALDKGRLPLYNRIGEFTTICEALDICFPVEVQKSIKRPWAQRLAPRPR